MTPALAAAYSIGWPDMPCLSYIRRSRPIIPAIDAILIILPCPRSAILGENALQHSKGPIKLSQIIATMSSVLRSNKCPGELPTQQFERTLQSDDLPERQLVHIANRHVLLLRPQRREEVHPKADVR